MKKYPIYLIAIALGVITSLSIEAQDYHFSQFDALGQTYQPALTGVFDDYKYRGATQYRNQWRPLANRPFSTFALSYDMPIHPRWGVGAYLINYDGARVFNAFNLVVSGAYKITDPSQKKHLLSTGLQIGIIYKNINNSDLLFESQYDNGQFNPTLPSNEEFQRLSKIMPEFNMGFYYEWTDKNNVYHPYFGASIFHISSPKQSLLTNSSDSRLPRRYVLNTGSKFDVNDEVKVDVKGLYQYQGKAQEWVFGVTSSYLLGDQKTVLKLGALYRLKDAVSMLTGVTYEDLTFTISYDITTSSLRGFNGGKGAMEFTLSYAPSRLHR